MRYAGNNNNNIVIFISHLFLLLTEIICLMKIKLFFVKFSNVIMPRNGTVEKQRTRTGTRSVPENGLRASLVDAAYSGADSLIGCPFSRLVEAQNFRERRP